MEIPPPGPAVETVMKAVVALSTSEAKIDAINCVLFTKVVLLTLPFQFTTELGVNPAPLTVQANNKSRTVSSPNPTFDATYSGFVLGDTPASLSGALTCSTPAQANSPAGSYPINCGGQSSTNYSIRLSSLRRKLNTQILEI